MVGFTKYVENEVDIEIDLDEFADAYGGYKELILDCFSLLTEREIEDVLNTHSSSRGIIADLYEAFTNKKQDEVNRLLVDLFNTELGRIA